MRRRSDLLVALGLLVVGQAEVALTGVGGNQLLAHLLWAIVALAAYFRRSHPLVFALVCVGGMVPATWFDLVSTWSVIFPIAGPLSIFGVGLYGRDTVRSAVAALGFALAAIAIVWLNQKTGEAGFHYLGFEWVRFVTIYVGSAGAGILLRDRSDALASAASRLESLPPAESEIEATAAATRQEIAREVYAVVRNYLNRIQIAIGDARRQLDTSPTVARSAGTRAKTLSQRAMDEMRNMLGLLRADPAPPVTAAPEAEPRSLPRRIGEFLGGQALVLLILANGILNAFFTFDDRALIGGELGLAGRLAGAVLTAALFVPRRRWPLVPVIGIPALLFVRVFWLDDRLPLDLFVWAAVFVAAAYLRPPAFAAGGGLFVLASALATAWAIEPETPWQAYVAFSLTTGAVWLIGAACRDRVAQTVEIERLEAEEGRRLEEAKRRAVREEKLAVARELHDLVGHSLTAITLQCAGVERMIPGDLPRAGEILTTVAALTEEANSELADLFVALSGYREPVLPTLDSLPVLAAKMRDLGTEVSLDTTGDLATVPSGPGAAAYRIVQESLANAGKHSSGPVRARVELRTDRIELTIENREGDRRGPGHGLGLIGIRERAEAYGGRVQAGPDGHGSWRVQAEVPLSPATMSPLS